MFHQAAILILISLSISDLISAAPVTESTITPPPTPTTIPSEDGINSKKADVSNRPVSGETWSLTQNWLISSINQLKSEVNQLGRSYNDHVSEQESESSHSQQSLAHDLAVLRADHTIMSNQQQMLIKLLKERLTSASAAAAAAVPATTTFIQVQEKIASPVKLLHEERITTEGGEGKQQEPDAVDDEEDEDSSQNHGKRHHHRHRHHHHKHKHEKFDQLKDREEQFEQQSSQQISSIKSELSALHDITISMFHEMQDLEKKMEKQQN